MPLPFTSPNKGRPKPEVEEKQALFSLGVAEQPPRPGESAWSSVMARVKRRRVIIGAGVLIAAMALVALIVVLVRSASGGGQGHGTARNKALCPRHYDKHAFEMVFFAVGDWGRRNANQRDAAALMAGAAECMAPHFIISTGDNFYPSGLKALDDPMFDQTFTHMYSEPALQVPWFAVLGNHDYGDGVTSKEANGVCGGATLSQCPQGCCFSPLWQTNNRLASSKDARWYALQGVQTRSYLLAHGRSLDVIYVDTPPLIPRYREAPWATLAGGIITQSPEGIKSKLIAALKESTATWRVVVGHHPVRSFGDHCKGDSPDCDDMAFMIPLLTKYNVSMYLNGHDHNLQVIKDKEDPVLYLVTGAGSDVRKAEFEKPHGKTMYAADDQGFMAFGVAGTSLKVFVYTKQAQGVAYEVTVSPFGAAPQVVGKRLD